MGPSPRRRALIAPATLIGTFLAALDSTAIGNPGELRVGKLSDNYGRKPIYLVGIFLFLAGSVLAWASESVSGPAFYGLCAPGLVSLAVAAFFPGGTAKSLINSEEDPVV